MLEGFATKGDGRFTIHFQRINREEFGFRLVDGEEEELGSVLKCKDKTLQTLSGMTDKSHVVRIQGSGGD